MQVDDKVGVGDTILFISNPQLGYNSTFEIISWRQ